MSSQNLFHDKVSSLEGVSVHTGFPNPSIDASLKDLDLNQLLVFHSAATYFMKVSESGGEWQHLGIFTNDIVLIDRALAARANDVVAWWQNDSFTLGYLKEVPKHATVWGVVTATIHRFKEMQP